MYNTELNLTSSDESGFEAKTNEGFVFVGIPVPMSCVFAGNLCAYLLMQNSKCACACAVILSRPLHRGLL